LRGFEGFGCSFPLGNPTIVILVLFLGKIQLIIEILGEYIDPPMKNPDALRALSSRAPKALKASQTAFRVQNLRIALLR
jgi:hypothetical protein